MPDSPPFEMDQFDQTRFSTPVSELDDHRQQPGTLPRTESISLPRSRRGTVASVVDSTNLHRIQEALQREGMSPRDFEQAVDDTKSDRSVRFDTSSIRRTPNQSPILGRRGTFHRLRENENEQQDGNKSRASSRSRSTSPPNSVDAFAEPRRARTGTVASRAPEELGLELQRTASIGSRRRRGTFSDGRSLKPDDDDASSARSSAEEDVCFPQPEEPYKTYTIDFEELDEFVAEQEAEELEETPVQQSLHHNSGSSADSHLSKPRIFHDLRPKSKDRNETQAPTANGDAVIDVEKANHQAEVRSNMDKVSTRSMHRRPSVPEMPVNRWTFFSSDLDDAIFASKLGALLMPGETFQDLFQLNPEGGCWWLDMLNPTEEEITAVCKAFQVHPLTREDIFQQETREKVELFKMYYFVCFRSFNQVASKDDEEHYLEPVNVYAVVFREGLLTFTFCPNPHAANVRKRISRLRDYMALSADWICYALIDDIVDTFGPIITDIQLQTDAIEDEVFTARVEDSRTILKAIGDGRKRVMHLMRLLGGKADVIKGFAKRCNDQYSVAPRGDVGMYLSDIQDHVVTMMSNLGQFEKMLSRSHSNYLAQIQVDSITQGNTINETLGKVTLIATILVPLNLITGLFGMNVEVPGKNVNNLAWFFGIIGVILAFVCSCLIVAKRMRLI